MAKDTLRVDGLNRYLYTVNNPVNFVDYNGMMVMDADIGTSVTPNPTEDLDQIIEKIKKQAVEANNHFNKTNKGNNYIQDTNNAHNEVVENNCGENDDNSQVIQQTVLAIQDYLFHSAELTGSMNWQADFINHLAYAESLIPDGLTAQERKAIIDYIVVTDIRRMQLTYGAIYNLSGNNLTISYWQTGGKEYEALKPLYESYPRFDVPDLPDTLDALLTVWHTKWLLYCLGRNSN